MRKYIFVLLSIVALSLSAQNIHSGYHSNAFILNSNSNPASFPEAKVVIGFPGLSNFSLGLQSPLSFNELFEKGEDDSLRLNIPSVPSFLGENDALLLNARNQLFYFGLKVGKKKNIFAYMGDEIVADIGIKLSTNLFDYLMQGNAQFLNRQMNFKDERLNVSVYNSFYIGVSSIINNKLNVGSRIKLLNGIANVNTDYLNLGIYTDSTSIPIFQTTMLANYNIMTSGLTSSSDPLLNSGFAIDLGASYKFNKKFEFSFAINDLGSINWEEVNNEFYTTDGEVEFIIDGLIQSSSGDEDLEAQLEEILDSLTITMEPILTTGSYKTKLNSSVFLGVAYTLNKQHSFSLLFHTRNNLDSRLNVFNLGYQFQVTESLELLASYQNFNGLSNLGTGFVWSPGALQMHLILDNILAADLFDAKNLFLQLGFSIQFGKKPTVRKTRKKNGLR